MAQHEARDWVSMPPEKLMQPERRGPPVDAADVYEVVVSLMDTVIDHGLYTDPIVPISEQMAQKYTGGHYRAVRGKKAYLLRALYISGGTGGFDVYRLGNAIWVMHGCLGGGQPLSRSALVVNLDFMPKKVYVTAVVSSQ